MSILVVNLDIEFLLDSLLYDYFLVHVED